VFFSHIARIVAVIVLVLGAGQVLIGLSIANEWMGLSAANLGEYTRSATTGQIIDRGIYGMLVAVALGTLAEIGLAIRKSSRGQ
jgi:hypothetical protein